MGEDGFLDQLLLFYLDWRVFILRNIWRGILDSKLDHICLEKICDEGEEDCLDESEGNQEVVLLTVEVYKVFSQVD